MANGQKAYKIQKKQSKNYEAYPNPYDFRKSGWLFDAGLTATFNPNKNKELLTSSDSSIVNSGPVRPGIQLNVGRYLSLKKGHKIFKYIDYNLGYKLLWNSEVQELKVDSSGYSQKTRLDNAAHYANLNLNFNNIISFSDYVFLQNTLGFNVDYRFAKNLSGEGINANNEPDEFIAQVHYKLGLGFMINNNMALIPYAELPLYNISPTQDNFSQLDYFNGSYQSVIIGARLMLFRLGQKECPTAKGVGLDPNQKNGY